MLDFSGLKIYKLKILQLILVLSLCVFIYLQLKTDSQSPFPVIAQGSYFGRIIQSKEDPVIYFKLEANGPENCTDPDCKPKIAIYSETTEQSENDSLSWEQGRPLLLKSKGLFFRLNQDNNCTQHIEFQNYCGKATNLNNAQQGNWSLIKMETVPVSKQEQEFLQQVLLTENKTLKEQMLKSSLHEIQQESQKLNLALQDAESIRNKSDTRFSTEQQKITDLKSLIDQEEIKLKALQDNFEIAKSVTPKGRITLLSRQILQKEFDLIRPVGLDADKLELLEQAKKAREVLALKKQVELLE